MAGQKNVGILGFQWLTSVPLTASVCKAVAGVERNRLYFAEIIAALALALPTENPEEPIREAGYLLNWGTHYMLWFCFRRPRA